MGACIACADTKRPEFGRARTISLLAGGNRCPSRTIRTRIGVNYGYTHAVRLERYACQWSVKFCAPGPLGAYLVIRGSYTKLGHTSLAPGVVGASIEGLEHRSAIMRDRHCSSVPSALAPFASGLPFLLISQRSCWQHTTLTSSAMGRCQSRSSAPAHDPVLHSSTALSTE
ncbi:hypothetical protein AURDEDRAFT_117803 [Auricularia subglabra TFB-10046 SS5]|uniref:Uncharacterized protein n=1 Tax=Auricularia subglabra (strain TFB-10046 / SS5) TaxID=717982 RepID=J0WNA3_AURST|nr:hypothetical protein AURDEDRAFT_117803 [Auricularia subglabra TFB-10046 SS5]